jgi:glycosyltransferase involved in cell wall biosynthesis
MRVIQVPYCYYPDPVGGTEVYVENLARYLMRFGIESIISAPTQDKTKTYFHNEVKVRRFLVSNKLKLSELYGEGDPLAAKEFGKILDEEKPDIVHMHAFTSGASLLLAMEVKKRSIKLFFTYHTPTVSCQRGTLMFRGNTVCDGVLNVHKCASCALHGLGVNSIIANSLGILAPSFGKGLGRLNLEGGVWTALRMAELIAYRHNAFKCLMQEADGIIALCNWSKDLLIRNDIPQEKIKVIRHGLAQNYQKPASFSKKQDNSTVKLAFFGRIHHTKGLDIIIKALKLSPDLSVRLDIYGVLQGEEKYYRDLLGMVRNDSRICFKQSVPQSKTIEILSGYDLLVVPSRWLETGPLVILEAFAAGIPVVGSNIGGIAEIVEDGINGLLVEPNSINEWRKVLRRICQNKDLLLRLRDKIHSPLNMQSVADQVNLLYQKVLRSGR